jgi:hypothetical protein
MHKNQDPKRMYKDSVSASSKDSCYGAISDDLKNNIPESVVFGFESDFNPRVKDELVEKANDKANSAITRTHNKILKTYTDHEIARMRRQKYLLLVIILLTAGQLLFFNCIIRMAVKESLLLVKSEIINSDITNNLFTILKYYIGATIVELIGMVWFVTKATFSPDHVKTLELILNEKPSVRNVKTE